MKKLLITVGVLVALLIILAIAAEAAKPTQPNFYPTFNVNKKKPMDLYVLNNEAEVLFNGCQIKRMAKDASVVIESVYQENHYEPGPQNTYLRISASGLALHEHEDSEQNVLSFAAAGNTVVLFTPEIPKMISDSTGVTSVTSAPSNSQNIKVYTTKNPENKIVLNKGSFNSGFKLSTLNNNIKILGYQTVDNKEIPNFVAVKYGLGTIIINAHPEIFSNYYLLRGNNYKYAQDAASLIPRGTIYWQVGTGGVRAKSRGLLDSFLREPAFRSFWYLAIAVLTLFIFFNARRKQRVVPVVPPLTNTTIDFARTIGNLYHQEGNHTTIIDKKIIYFLEHIRREYFIDTYNLNDEFADKLHTKTGKPKKDIYAVIALIKKHRQNLDSSETDLIEINNAIEKLRL